MIKAEIVADSKNEFNDRITTMLVTFPRIILAEFNTHRMFSRNTASSRAIPFEKMVKSVEENPFVPIAWQKDHKGMQGSKYITDNVIIADSIKHWLNSMDYAIAESSRLHDLEVTKQLCNRLLEPFMWCTVLVTATEWENFFALRCPQYGVNDDVRRFRSKKDTIKAYPNTKEWSNEYWFTANNGQAEIHMMALAEAMWDAYNESTPKELKAGEWHIPFEDKIDKQKLINEIPLGQNYKNFEEEFSVKISTVMAARTSYTVVGADQKPLNYERMLEIHDELLAANPKHMSPFEHCAKAISNDEKIVYTTDFYDNTNTDRNVIAARTEGGWIGNFKGFIQYRKMIPNENITTTHYFNL